MGTLVVDDSQTFGPFRDGVLRAKDDDDRPATMTGRRAGRHRARRDRRATRPHGHVGADVVRGDAQGRASIQGGRVRMAVDDLLIAGRLVEVSGRRGARGYRAVATAVPRLLPRNLRHDRCRDCCRDCCPYIEGSAGRSHTGSAAGSVGRSGPRWAAVRGTVTTYLPPGISSTPTERRHSMSRGHGAVQRRILEQLKLNTNDSAADHPHQRTAIVDHGAGPGRRRRHPSHHRIHPAGGAQLAAEGLVETRHVSRERPVRGTAVWRPTDLRPALSSKPPRDR